MEPTTAPKECKHSDLFYSLISGSKYNYQYIKDCEAGAGAGPAAKIIRKYTLSEQIFPDSLKIRQNPAN